MGSLNVCSGESSTRTLFMRVMETFDDDDDDHQALFEIDGLTWIGLDTYIHILRDL